MLKKIIYSVKVNDTHMFHVNADNHSDAESEAIAFYIKNSYFTGDINRISIKPIVEISDIVNLPKEIVSIREKGKLSLLEAILMMNCGWSGSDEEALYHAALKVIDREGNILKHRHI